MATINRVSGTERKAGSGRKPGSVSFQNISLSSLLNIFANREQHIPVSRVWLQQFLMPPQGSVAESSENHVSAGGVTIETGEVAQTVAIRDLNEE